MNLGESISNQVETVYTDYDKIKSIVDLGYFLADYVVSGGVVTKDVTNNNVINITEIIASLDNDVTRREATSFTTTTASTTYYLDYMAAGDFNFDTSHYSGTYLPVAQVTTDANKNVLVITDMRGTIGGVRFNADPTYGSTSLSDIGDLDDLLTTDKTSLVAAINEKIGTVKNGGVYAKALNDVGIVAAGSLDHAKFQIANNKALKVVFWGDSITEGLDQTSGEDAYTKRIERALVDALPNTAITTYNYALGGTGIGSVNDTDPLVVGRRPWVTTAKSWQSYVRDAKPDLVVLAFGMNDAGAEEPNTFSNLTTIIATMATWNPAPSVVLVPTMLPTLNLSLYGQKQQDTLRIARTTREFAKENGIALADAGRVWQILRDGTDDETRIGAQEYIFEGYPVGWTGSTAFFTHTTNTLAPIDGTSGKFVGRDRSFYNGGIELDVIPVAAGIENAAYIQYRVADQGNVSVLVVAGDGATGQVYLFTSASLTAIAGVQDLTIPVGSATRIQISPRGPNHKIYVNYALVIDHTEYRMMGDGAIAFGSTGLVPTFQNLTLTFDDPIQGDPYYTEADLLGLPNSTESGNGINHPTGLGHAMVYYPAFNGIIRELTQVKENSFFLPFQIDAIYWGTPGVGYPTLTDAGETLYYKLVDKYDKYKGLALRRLDNSVYYPLSSVAVSTATLAQLEPGKFAYYVADSTTDFVWFSVPAAGAVTWDVELYKYV